MAHFEHELLHGVSDTRRVRFTSKVIVLKQSYSVRSVEY